MEYIDRTTQIIEFLKAENFISYKELAKRLFASEATIRRDCKKLGEKMNAKIVKNGVMFTDGSSTEYSLLLRLKINAKEKEIIAKLASEYLYNGISCFIDGSTTAGMLVQYIKDLNNVTVVTNSLDNALLINYNTRAKIYLAGGLLSKDNNSAQSNQAVDFLNRFTADVAFVSAKGIDENGFTSEALDEVKGCKTTMLLNAKTKILLCDSSKFNSSFLFKNWNISQFDVLVTDKKPSDKIILLCRRSKTRLIYKNASSK